MPPEVPYYSSYANPVVKVSLPSSPETEAYNLNIVPKYFKGNKGMKIPGKKIIPLFVVVLSSLSIVRLLRLAITTSSSSPPLPALPPYLQQAASHPTMNNKVYVNATTVLSKKEFKFLSKIVRNRAPCNLLIFGFEHQYLKLQSINSGGITVFLEDDPEKIESVREKSISTVVYKVEHKIPAKKAYRLLKHARTSPACEPKFGNVQNSTCKLALKGLPQEVYKLKWDIIVIDGPSGHSAEAPGRMAAIYTAAVIARAGNTVDVIVHDVDRTIEKWFSWEFLCDENLASSKGKLWDFRISGKLNSTRFCQ